MSESVPFELKLDLVSPVILPFHTTLDGLLSFAAEVMTGLRGDDLVPHIPLERDPDSGIFRASSIFLGPEVHYLDRIKVRSMRSADDLDIRNIGPKRTAKGKVSTRPYTPLDKKRGDYANKLSKYVTVMAPTATCYGVGKPADILHLLELVIGLGKHANQGQGQIAGRSIREIADDRSWIAADGTPARPLPVALWESISATPVEQVTHGLSPCRFPYWATDWEACVMPRRIAG
ncbi:hypothetical protein VRRI112168_03755 [Vreelandella rituensis]|uniref:Uncharacterized protein n=1 Tax=Vreelandella rituensis TaxID=2282306 RepID=A0A368U9X0_9GAMM|nr:hypothetical protein [Halomonas rituensis]RCV93765.1 hypothetical protein DU506_01010 [Halomonas rituensis]